MRILCEQEVLNEAVSVVSRAVSSRSSLPVLEGVYIKASDDGKVRLTGNDMEIGIEAVIDAEVMQPGEIVINAKMLSGIIRSLAPGKVSVETNDKNQTLIKSGGAKFEIAGIASDEFPDLPIVDPEYSISIPASILKEMITKTGFAVAVSENNPILTGCLLEIRNTGLTMVALDGFRLAMCKTDMENDFEEHSMIIPEKSLNCSTAQLLESIQRVSLIILNDVVKSPVRFNIEDGNINISCTTSAGSVDDNIPIDLTDAALEIGFYNRYLLEAFRVIDSEIVHIKLNTATGPMVITPTDGDDFLYLILPLRLHAE